LRTTKQFIGAFVSKTNRRLITQACPHHHHKGRL
jgi:hypothetical protein